MDFLLASLGLLILLLAGDFLVRGAVNLSLRLGVPALIVSLTVVAFGTSAPELLISVQAVLDGAPGLALGNVVGSNTANVLIVLGLPALLAGLATSGCDCRKSYVQMLLVTAMFIALCWDGRIGRIDALVLLAAMGLVLTDQFRDARNHRRNGTPVSLESADPQMPGWRIALLLAVGIVGLPLGANILVGAAVRLAHDLGVSDAVIGLSLVALGTSLPELATTVMAAYRGRAEVALGNVIGSNAFNLLLIIGVAGLVAPIPVAPGFLRTDLWVMAAASLALVPFVFFGQDMTKRWGILLLGLYSLYIYTIYL